MELIQTFVKKLGYMWYIMNPSEHLFERVEDVPDYHIEIIPAVIFIITLEQVLHLIRGKKLMRLNDSVTNISQMILVQLCKIPLYGAELLVYSWVYNNWRIGSLPWNSPWTWLLCLVITDFSFYWMHRATHQISILWLFHEPHHSSEEFNLTVPLRLSVVTSSTLWLTYVPMALLIPPSVFMVHYQMNIIFQYWLHSEYVPRLGFLEYVFVTPSHHRVHHGRNRRCIDKNFGSVFILWDRLFGTFESEGSGKIHFGVTKPLQSFNPIFIQANHLLNIIQRWKTVNGFSNKLSLILKGPGWKPGTTWLGNIEDIIEPTNDTKYDPKLPKWLDVYVALHTAALVIGYLLLTVFLSIISSWTAALSGFYMLFTTIAIGCLLDLSPWGPVVELLRCPLYFWLDWVIQKELVVHDAFVSLSIYTFRSLFFASFVFWIFAIPFVTDRGRTKKQRF